MKTMPLNGVNLKLLEVHLLNPAALDASRPPARTAKGSRGGLGGLGFQGCHFALESLLPPE